MKKSYTELDPKPTDGIVAYVGHRHMDKWAGRRTNGRGKGRDLHIRCPCLHREERLRGELRNWGSFVIYNMNSQNLRLRKIGRIE
jgi:hypothetical protein